jgi:hypothetical protein
MASLEEEVEAACTTLADVAVLGFDIEWKVTYRTGEAPRPAALIQLCVPSTSASGAECYLLHVARTGITPGLTRLLVAPTPLKVGLNISADAMKLYRDHGGLTMGGVVELEHLAQTKFYPAPSQRYSLTLLCERLLHRHVRPRRLPPPHTLTRPSSLPTPPPTDQQQHAPRSYPRATGFAARTGRRAR